MAPLLSKPDPSRRHRLRLLAATAIGLASGMHAQVFANPFGAAPVSDQRLSDMRGGFELPNGMNVAVAVEIETRVDGALALRTVLNLVDTSKAALEGFVPSGPNLNLPDWTVAPASSANPLAAPPASATEVSPPAAVMTAEPVGDPTPPAALAATVPVTPVVVSAVAPIAEATPSAPDSVPISTPTVTASAVSVSVVASAPTPVSPVISAPTVSLNIAPGAAEAAAISAPVPAIEVQSDLGSVTVEQTAMGSVVILKGPDLEIQHLTGNSTGILIANTLDNRVIDTIATVNVSLSDSAVPVGNMMLRMEAVVLNAVGGLMY